MVKSFNPSTIGVKKLILKRQGLWSLGGNGVSALSGLLLFMMSTNRLSSAEFGTWVLFQAVSTLFDMFRTGLILPGFLQQAAGQSSQSKASIHQSVAVLNGSVGLIQVVLCLAGMWLTHETSSLHFFFTYYPMVLISGSMITLAEWRMQSQHRFHLILIVRLVNRIPVLILCFFFLGSKVDLVFAQSVSNIITWLFLPLFGFQLTAKTTGANVANIKRLLQFGKYATPAQLAATLLRSSDTFMISGFLGSAATGLYGAAARFLEFFELPIRSAASVNFNKMTAIMNSGKTNEGVSFALGKMIRMTLFVLPVSILLIIFAPELIQFISGSQYAGTVPILRVIAIYCLLIPADRYIGLVLEAMGKPRLNLIKVTAMLLMNITTNLIALIVFQTALAVAVTSIITFLFGILLGGWFVLTKGLNNSKEVFKIRTALSINS